MSDNDLPIPEMDTDPGSIFDEPSTTFTPDVPVDNVNPQVTRGQEEEPEQLPGTPGADPARGLVFARDAYGNLKCAWVVNGNQVEALRAPTPEEEQLAPRAKWKVLQQQGAVQPGMPQAVGAVPFGQPRGMQPMQSAAMQQPAPAQPGWPANLGQAAAAAPGGFSLGKLILGVGIVGGLGFAAWKAYEYMESKATDDELEEADDVDEEVRV